MNNPMNDRNDFYSEDFNEDDYYAEEERRLRSEEQIKLYIVAALVLIVVVSSVLIGVIMIVGSAIEAVTVCDSKGACFAAGYFLGILLVH